MSRVQRVLGHCKSLVAHFKKSTKETYKLQKQEKATPTYAHPGLCDKMGGSTPAMLERLMEQQAPTAAVLIDGRVRHLMPEGEGWSVIEVLVDILKLFQQATEAMGAVRYPTFSTVKPLLYKLVSTEHSKSKTQQWQRRISWKSGGTSMNVTTLHLWQGFSM